MIYADIIIDISHEKLDRSFQYIVPEELESEIRVGMVAAVPFGNCQRKGYVIGLSREPKISPEKLKPVGKLLSSQETTEARLVSLAAWMRERYGSTMAQALKTVLPVREKIRAKEKRMICLNVERKEAEKLAQTLESGRCKARARLVRALLEEGSLDYTEAAARLRINASVLKPLAEKGIVRIEQDEVYRMSVDGDVIPREELSVLTPVQQRGSDPWNYRKRKNSGVYEADTDGGGKRTAGDRSDSGDCSYLSDSKKILRMVWRKSLCTEFQAFARREV